MKFAGGFILCKSSVFKHDNLYNRIRNKIIDDYNIAKLLKQKGNIWLGITNKIVSKRSYNHLRAIWKMVTRTAFEQLKKSYTILIISLVGFFLTYLSPMIIMILLCFLKYEHDILIIITITLNFISFLIMTLIYFPTARFYSLSGVYYLTLPISALFYFLMTLSSGINNLVLMEIIGREENISKFNSTYISTLLSGKSFKDENFPVASFFIANNIKKKIRDFYFFAEQLMT